MSTYRYENARCSIDIRESAADALNAFIWVREGRKEAAIIFPKKDAPTVAAELLKAAGRTDLAGYIEAVIAEEAEAARVAEAVSPQGLTGCRLCNRGITEAKAAREAVEKAEAEAAMKKLSERRDGVIAMLCPEAVRANNLPAWNELSLLDQRAINRILNLEDGK